MRSIFYILTGLLFLLGCEEVPTTSGRKTAVVEAYLYEGEPVNHVVVSEIVPLGAPTSSVLISGLQINLRHGNQSVVLSEIAGNPGVYEDAQAALTITSGETYSLAFTHEGRNLVSETTIPVPPSGGSLSESEITLPQINAQVDLIAFSKAAHPVILSWVNPQREPYFIKMENIEANPQPIDKNDVVPIKFSLVSQPTYAEGFILRPLLHYKQFGMHKITLYHVNPEYTFLYESLNQDSRYLNEPYTNVQNGAGIFTGFASQVLYFEVKKP